ncbi:peptidase C14 [Penicillium herquei]|nr:peptidase C14 [Penicillium herquei]
MKIRRGGNNSRSGKLEVIYDPPDAKFEIIAVPGLGADPEHTWTCRNPAKPGEGTHLLRDLLSNDFPQARICNYAYDSLWLGDAPVKTTEEIGENLLRELKKNRSYHVH